MRRETVRMVKLGAAEATYGVNAKIAAVSIDAGDTRPAAVTLYNDVEHKWVARRRANAADSAISFPALAMFRFGPLEVVDVEVETVVRDALVKIGYAWLIKENDPLEATSAGDYYNRALLQHLNWFMRNEQSSGFRTRNGIIVRSIKSLTQDDVTEDWDGAVCMAQSIVTFKVRETSP